MGPMDKPTYKVGEDPVELIARRHQPVHRTGLVGIKGLGRFGMVGVLSTLVYFVTASLLGRPPIGVNPVVANTLGVAVSLLVSYVGHHQYTFKVQDGHRRYLPRFLVVTAGLFVLSSAATAIASYVWLFDHVAVTACITVCYPIASYLLNSLWTFSHRQSSVKNAESSW